MKEEKSFNERKYVNRDYHISTDSVILRQMSIFMIFLVITIPISISNAYAVNYISKVLVSGEDGIDGYVRYVDSLAVDIDVYVDVNLSSPEQVRVGAAYFQQCSKLDNHSYNCKFKAPEKSTFYVSTQMASITVRNPDGHQVAMYNKPYFVDDLPPSIDSFSVVPNPAGKTNVTISYAINDHSYQKTSSLRCTGVSSITLLRGNESLKDVDVNSTKCQIRDSLVMDALSVSDNSPEKLCIKAGDRFGQESEPYCIDFFADSTGPEFDNLRIAFSNGSTMKEIAARHYVGKVYVDIKYDGVAIDPTNVFADFTMIGDPYSFKRPASSCQDSSNPSNSSQITCVWDGVSIRLNGSTEASVSFNASDVVGNWNSATLSQSITVDGTAPEVVDIVSLYFVNDTHYLKKSNNTIMAKILESGSGISKDNVALDLSHIGLGKSVSPDECNNSICYWYGLDASGSDGSVVEVTMSKLKDNVGNDASGFKKKFVLDLLPPNIDSLVINSTGFLSQYNLSLAVKGDFLYVHAIISDTVSKEIKANADLRKITLATGNLSDPNYIDHILTPGACTKNASRSWRCEWAVQITNDGPGNMPIHFIFEDYVGNKNYVTEYFYVYGHENASKDYYRHEIGASSPEKIDKQIMTLYDAFIYYPIRLVPKTTKTLVPLHIEIGNCSTNRAYLRGNVPMIYDFNPVGTTAPYDMFIKYVLDPTPPPEDTLDVSCDIEILSLVENQMIVAETENINVTLQFYNLPYGTLSGNVIEEINRVKSGWLVSQEWIETVDDVIKIGRTICGLIGTIQSLLHIFSTVTGFWGTCCGSVVASPECCPSMKASATATKGLAATLQSFMNKAQKFCSYLDCRYYSDAKTDANKPENKNTKKSWFGSVGKGLNKWWTWASTSYGSNKGYLGNVEPKNSIILSAVFLCVPGIVYNLQKARVIECRYINCLKNSASGMPLKACVDEREFLFCKFVWGEVFNLIPFAAAFSNIATNVKAALQNTPSLLLAGTKAYCELQCTTPALSSMCSVCYWLEFFDEFASTMCSLGISIGKQDCTPIWHGFSVDDSECDRALE